LKSTC